MLQGFGDLLREYRLRAGLTQRELATRAGLSTRTISDLERGVHAAPFRHTIDALARSLELTSEQVAAIEASVVRVPSPVRDSTLAVRIPSSLMPIVGREREVEQCIDLIVGEKVRLLTLAGIGGVGKTRLAQEVGHRLASLRHSVHLVRLDELESEEAVLPAIARSLGLNVDEATSAADMIAFRLLEEESVIILESFEHLMGARTGLASLLERAPGLHVIVTSRRPLHIQGENVLLVAPLALPEGPGSASGASEFERIEASGAVQMFVAVARMNSPNFRLTQTNATAVRDIVARMDGLPLGIELTATQTFLLTPEEIVGDLERGSDGLDWPRPVLPSMQSEIRDTILWSYALLRPDQQRLLRFCSIGSGSWTVDHFASLDVSDGEAHPAGDALGDVVSGGFIRRTEDASGRSCFRMLRIVRECMQDELRAAGEWEEAHERFAAMMSRIVQSATAEVQPISAAYQAPALDAEEENLQRALEWYLTTGQVGVGVELLWRSRVWLLARSRRWAGDWLEAASASSGVDAGVQAMIRALLAMRLASLAAFSAASEQLEVALPALEAAGLGEEARETILLVSWAPDLPVEVVREADASVEDYRQAGDLIRYSHALASRGSRKRMSGDYAGAEVDFRQVLRLDRWLLPHVDPRLQLGVVYLHLGRLDEARAILESTIESMPYDHSTNGPFMLALLGLISQMTSEEERAAAAFRRSLLAARVIGSAHPFGLCLEGAAWVAAGHGEWLDAACLLGAAGRNDLPFHLRSVLGLGPETRARVQDALSEGEYIASRRVGEMLPLEQALALAMKHLDTGTRPGRHLRGGSAAQSGY